MLLRSKFTDEKHLVYMRWNVRDRARYKTEMKGTKSTKTRHVSIDSPILDRAFSSSARLPM
jgi:hypothetical protein